MRLQEYLAETKQTPAEFARQIDVARHSVERYLSGRIPESSVMAKIIEATNGEVTANDFFELPNEEAA